MNFQNRILLLFIPLIIMLFVVACTTEEISEPKNENEISQESSIETVDFDYEIVSQEGFLIYVYSSSKDLNQLKNLIPIIKKEYNFPIMQVMFFDNKELAKSASSKTELSNKEVLSWFATYNYNINTDTDELIETYNNIFFSDDNSDN